MRLTTHVLDTSAGHPAIGVRIQLYDADRRLLAEVTTNDQGRASLLDGDAPAGTYELVFDVGTYFGSGFFGEVPVRFTVADPAAHYHVPLLVTPWSYSTYRGS